VGVGGGDGVVVLLWRVVVETACPACAQREREREVMMVLSFSRRH
jgi:hypothetical protein